MWHSSLTVKNENDLERVQKAALRIILKDRYQSYNQPLYVNERMSTEFGTSRILGDESLTKQICPVTPKYKL